MSEFSNSFHALRMPRGALRDALVQARISGCIAGANERWVSFVADAPSARLVQHVRAEWLLHYMFADDWGLELTLYQDARERARVQVAAVAPTRELAYDAGAVASLLTVLEAAHAVEADARLHLMRELARGASLEPLAERVGSLLSLPAFRWLSLHYLLALGPNQLMQRFPGCEEF